MTVDQVLDEALGYSEAFRKMQYTAEEIFFGWDAAQVFIMLRAEEKEFVAICGPYTGTGDDLKRLWAEKVAWWNSATNEECKKLWERSTARCEAVRLISAMVVKGLPMRRSHLRHQPLH